MIAPRRTATALLLLCALALTTVGCGVKAEGGNTGGRGGTTDTTAPADTSEPSKDTTETTEAPDESTDSTDTSVPDFGDFGKDELVKLYVDMGLTEKQATCLVDTIFDSAAGGKIDPSDRSAIFDYLATCEIDITDFGGSGSGN